MKKTNFIFINLFFFFSLLFLLVLFLLFKTFFITSYFNASSLSRNFVVGEDLSSSEEEKLPKKELKTEVWGKATIDSLLNHKSLQHLTKTSKNKEDKPLFYFKFNVNKGFFVSFEDFSTFTKNSDSKKWNFFIISKLKDDQKNKDGYFLFWFVAPKKPEIGKEFLVKLGIAMLSSKGDFVFFLKKEIKIKKNNVQNIIEEKVFPQVLEELKGYFYNSEKSYFHSRSWKLFWKKNQLQNLCVLATENKALEEIISNFNKNISSPVFSGVDGDFEFEFTKTKFTLKLINFVNYSVLLKSDKTPEKNYQNCSKSDAIAWKFLVKPTSLYREWLYDFLFKEKILDPKKILPLFRKHLKDNQFFKNLEKSQDKNYDEQKESFVDKHFPKERKEKLFNLINNLFDKNPFLYKLVDEKYDIGFFRNHSQIFYCFSPDNYQFSCDNKNEEYISLKKFTQKLLALSKELKEEEPLSLSLLKLEFNEIAFLDWMLQNFERKENNFIFTKFINTFFWIWINVKNLEFFEKNNFLKNYTKIFVHDLDKTPVIKDNLNPIYKYSWPETTGSNLWDYKKTVGKDIFDDRIFLKEEEEVFLYKKENLFLGREEFVVYLKARLASIFKLDETDENRELLARNNMEKLLEKSESEDTTFQIFRKYWKTTKENFYFSFFLEKEFNFPLNEYGINFSQIFFEPFGHIHKFIMNNPGYNDVQKKTKEGFFFKVMKKFLMKKTASESFRNQEKKSFWTFLFSLNKKKEKIVSLEKFLNDHWDEWFGFESTTPEKRALNLKHILNLVLWGEFTFPMISLDFNEAEWPAKKKEILQKFLQGFLIDADVLKWEEVFPDDKEKPKSEPKKLSLLDLNREMFEFFSTKAINKKIKPLFVFPEVSKLENWKTKLFEILVKLKRNKIWKLPIKAEGFAHPVIDINIYHLFEYASWDEVFEKENENKFGNNIARFVLDQIERQRKSFFENAKYFLKLKLNRLWNTWYRLKLFLTINDNVLSPFDPSPFLEKESDLTNFNTYTWFSKKVYQNTIQDINKINEKIQFKKSVLDFLKKNSCFLLQYDYDNQLLEFIDKEVTIYNPTENYKLMLNKYKDSPENFNFKNLFYKLAPWDLENKDTKCKEKVKKTTFFPTNIISSPFKNYSFSLYFILTRIDGMPESPNFEYLTIYELELLLFLQKTYDYLAHDYHSDFSAFFKKIVSDSITLKFNFIFSFLNNWKDFFERDSILNILEEYPFFDNQKSEDSDNLALLFKSLKSLLLLSQDKDLETFFILRNFQLDVMTEKQQNFFILFSKKLQDIKKTIKDIKNESPEFLTKELNTENPIASLLNLGKKRQKKYFEEKFSKFFEYYPMVNKMYLLGNSQITISNKVEKKIDLNGIYFLKSKENLDTDYLTNFQIRNIIKVTETDLDDFRQKFVDLLKKDIAPIWKIIYQYFNIDGFEKKIQELCVSFAKFDTKKPIFFTKKQLNSQNCLRNVKKNSLVDLGIFAAEKTNQNPENLSLPALEEIAKIQHFKPKQINDVLNFFIYEQTKKTQTNQFSLLVILTLFFSTLSFLFCFMIFLINIKKIYRAKWKKQKQEKISFL